MALTYSAVRQGVTHDGKRYVEADVTFDDSYPTGGEAVSLAAIGLDRVVRIELVYTVTPDGGTTATDTHGQQVFPATADPYAPKLLVYTAADTAAANESDQSGVVQRVRFVGN